MRTSKGFSKDEITDTRFRIYSIVKVLRLLLNFSLYSMSGSPGDVSEEPLT